VAPISLPSNEPAGSGIETAAHFGELGRCSRMADEAEALGGSTAATTVARPSMPTATMVSGPRSNDFPISNLPPQHDAIAITRVHGDRCQGKGRRRRPAAWPDEPSGAQAELLTQDGNSWTQVLVAGTDPKSALRSIACVAAEQCIAVGTYDTRAGTTVGVVASLNGDAATSRSLGTSTIWSVA
jgi:hypothetical protein